jgi:hypothetical protein
MTEFIDIITTLITNGFQITKVDRISPENWILFAHKFDKLGAKVSYCLLLSNDKTETAVIKSLIRASGSISAKAILVNDNFTTSECDCFTKERLYSLFGGIVNTGLVLIDNLPKVLDSLGHNELPNGLAGKAETLHEVYVKECLQFIMGSPTRRYGQERLFESLPDIVVLCKDQFMILVDSKAYKDGYAFSLDDINRFSRYVSEFTTRYSQFFGSVFKFLVVSGSFLDSSKALASRSDELYKACGCGISVIKSEDLALIVQRLSTNPEIRGSIMWKNVFSEIVVTSNTIEQERKRIEKDKIH